MKESTILRHNAQCVWTALEGLVDALDNHEKSLAESCAPRPEYAAVACKKEPIPENALEKMVWHLDEVLRIVGDMRDENSELHPGWRAEIEHHIRHIRPMIYDRAYAKMFAAGKIGHGGRVPYWAHP